MTAYAAAPYGDTAIADSMGEGAEASYHVPGVFDGNMLLKTMQTDETVVVYDTITRPCMQPPQIICQETILYRCPLIIQSRAHTEVLGCKGKSKKVIEKF